MKRFTGRLKDGRTAIILEPSNVHAPDRITPEGARWNYIRLDNGGIAITGDAAEFFSQYEDALQEADETAGHPGINAWQCDPDKNTECSKTGCYKHGGPCRLTLKREYAKDMQEA